MLAERASARGANARWFLWRMGLVYVAGVFLTYLGLGLGLLGFASAFGETHWVGRVAAFGAIALGLLALQEAIVPRVGDPPNGTGPHARLAAPSALFKARFTGVPMVRGTVQTVVVGGVAAGVAYGLARLVSQFGA